MKEYSKFEFKKLMMNMREVLEEKLDFEIYVEEYSSELTISINKENSEIAYIKIPYEEGSFSLNIERLTDDIDTLSHNKKTVIDYLLVFVKPISKEYGIPVFCTFCEDIDMDKYLKINK